MTTEHEQQICDLLQSCLAQDTEYGKIQALRLSAANRYALLPPRQKQVMACRVQGKSNKAIAHQLGISLKTVEAHRTAVTRIMETDSLIDLVNDGKLIGIIG